MSELTLSPLAHTWLIDIDGTIVRHNGHKSNAESLLEGVLAFWAQIPTTDKVVLLTARTAEEMKATLGFLDQQGLRYDHVLFEMPTGERVLINDCKPSGLKTAIALNVVRDKGLSGLRFSIDPNL